MNSMSGGAWSYNRFDAYEQKLNEAKKAKKDYDGDGKVESSKDEYFGSKDKAIKKAMGKGTCKKCEESKDDCECDDKKEVKENRAMANGGHRLVGDGSKPKGPSNPKNKTQTMMGKDGKPLFKEENIEEKAGCGYQEGGEVKKPKKKVVKEDVINHLIEHGYVNNEVSADILFNHVSDEFLESIEEDIIG